MKTKIGFCAAVVAFVFAMLLSISQPPAKADSLNAASYTLGANDPWIVVTATTSATITVILTGDDFSVEHLNIQDDGSTASAATDYIVIMRSQDGSGAAVTMAANYNDGVKDIIHAAGSDTFIGKWIPPGADGKYEVQIKAVGHGAKLKFLHGRSPKEAGQ